MIDRRMAFAEPFEKGARDLVCVANAAMAPERTGTSGFADGNRRESATAVCVNARRPRLGSNVRRRTIPIDDGGAAGMNRFNPNGMSRSREAAIPVVARSIGDTPVRAGPMASVRGAPREGRVLWCDHSDASEGPPL
jgi:hypothetical protein